MISYRQANPTEDNVAAKSLSRDTQLRNMRIVAVNAKVTFVLWLLEFLAVFFIAMAWVFIAGSTTFGTLTNSMIWLHVLIPYTFLMNTSYNKGRIIDEGWKTVVLNSFFFVKSCFSRRRRRELQSSRNLDQRSSVKDRNKKQNKSNRKHKKDCSSKLDDDKPSTCQIKNESDISIIATREYDIPSPVIQTLCRIEDLEPTPGNSLRFSDHLNRRKPNLIEQNLSCDSGDENSCHSFQGKSPRVLVGEKILSKMAENLNYEDAYIHYLRQLVEYEEILKCEDPVQEQNYKIEPFFDFKHLKNIKVKCSNNLRGNHSTKSKKQNRNDRDYQYQNHSHNELPLNINFSVEYIMRAQLRRDMLKHYPRFCDEKSRYHYFINSLIEFEESLIRC